MAEKDYDKIDYNMYSADLNLEKITLTQQAQLSITSRPPKSISLMLSDLKEVKYMIKKSAPNPSMVTSILIKRPKEDDE